MTQLGKEIHGFVTKSGLVSDVFVNNALMQMYSECGSVGLSRLVFDKMSERDVVSWSTMIRSYGKSRLLDEALDLIRDMHFVQIRPSEVAMISMMLEENVVPNEISMLSFVIECGFVRALEFGKWIHGYLLRNGFQMSMALVTALTDMYGKCGEVENSRALFDRMEKMDVMSCSAMISAYAQANCLDQAFDLFVQMRKVGIRPNKVTMVSLLSLCAEAGALDLGKWVHAYIDRQGMEADVILYTALVDMYAKSGDVDGAHGLFIESKDRDICMWNAMMTGFAMHGYGKEALKLFSEMEEHRVKPNHITFVGVLHACSHAGLVEEGKRLFDKMINDFGLVPKVEHYGCMVDLLGRAGLLDEAYETIKGMPVKPNAIVWGALVAACKIHKNPNLGELAAKELLKIDPQNCGYNVLMSNIYAAANRWSEVAGVRKTMKDTRMKKEPGLSSIEVNGSVHEFTMGDTSHPQYGKINAMLVEMKRKLKEMGYIPNTSAVLLNVDEEEKETALNYHSEKLAMAFGLIHTAPSTPIRVVKNLRICDDCHVVTKLLSKIYKRIIIVRDRNRFHHFKDGTCSCGNYW
ncbi:Pentatricopeptide repeat [Dillenia turbinata]|uniref:Pentatricopeptide repeat n=1 Tax=Dillenia turbinata TaxID=194707 RepID=A0AAN8UM65_9MAGN